jgi:hypothetical protein
MRETNGWRALAAAAVGLALGGLALVGGCVSYASYPAVPRNTAINDPNSPAMEEVMVAGLRYAVEKYPPGGRGEGENAGGEGGAEAGGGGGEAGARLALNLPEGLKPTVYERIARRVGSGAAPLTGETSHLPIYHVSYLRVRGDQAQINIVRPVVEMGLTPEGTPVMQEVKLQLRGGLQPWHVITSREWDPGVVDLPPLNYHTPIPASELAASRSPDDVYRPGKTTSKSRTVSAPENPGAEGETAPRQ